MTKGKNYQVIVINVDNPDEIFQADIQDVEIEMKAENEWHQGYDDDNGYTQELVHKAWHLFLNGKIREFEMQAGES